MRKDHMDIPLIITKMAREWWTILRGTGATLGLPLLSTIVLALPVAPAMAAQDHIVLQWAATQKIEQIIGDVDWADGTPTRSQTYTNYKVLANGLGYSFEHFNRAKNREELIFLFGDTVAFGTHSISPGLDINAVPAGAATSADTSTSPPPLQCPLSPSDSTSVPCSDSTYNYHGMDPLAWSPITDPEGGLDLHFFMNGPLPQFVVPPDLVTPSGTIKIATGGDDIPNSGISVNGQAYIVYSTGSEASCTQPCDPHANSFSVLVRFDEETQAFQTLRQVSAVPEGGHFVFTSLHHLPPSSTIFADPWILMFGVGDYRLSDVYLALVPARGFETGTGTLYFVRRDANGRPIWRPSQTDAKPVLLDDAPSPSIGNISVTFSPELRLWLMTYDADGTNPPATQGIYFRYATAPWGPWSPPQPIFNACTNGGFGSFIHYHAKGGDADCPSADPSPPGPAGPTIGQEKGDHDPETTRGGSFAPLMIERFTKVKDDTLSIYYTMSTWNPYTVVLMRSDFNIPRGPEVQSDSDGQPDFEVPTAPIVESGGSMP